MLTAPNNIVVTGATGFLGSHFLREWLCTESGHVFALARAKNNLSATDRIAAALQAAQLANGTPGQPLANTWTALEADVTLPLAGVHPDPLRAARIDTFWHFASDLRFEDRNYATTQRINVDGARHTLALAAALNVKRFVYISTAYVCGRQGGLIQETLTQPDRQFSNGYEASKAEAEHLLTAECDRLGIPLTILRPSIVIGPRSTQSAYGSDTGLFSLIQAVTWLRSSQSGRSANLRIPACPAAEINFIPVDCVVADMLALSSSGFGSAPIHHLTSSASVSVAQCWQAISEIIGIPNAVLVSSPIPDPTPAERMIARRLGFFLNYISVNRRFQRTLRPAWTLDAEQFAGYVRQGLERAQHTTPKPQPHAG